MSTEVATRPHADLAIVPVGKLLSNLEEVITLAKGLAVSSLVPDSLRGKPNDVAIILLYGCELGLPPMQAIQGIYVVEGRPMLSAQTWGTKIRQSGHKLEILSSTRTEATVCITRGDDKTRHVETFTLEDAVAAGLCKVIDGKVVSRSMKGKILPWEAYTRTMLRNRAITHCARYACPEAAFGNAGVWGEQYDENKDEVDLRPFIEEDGVIEGETVDPANAAQELADLAAEMKVGVRPAPVIEDAEEVGDPWGTRFAEQPRKTCDTCGLRSTDRAHHDEIATDRGYAEHEPVWIEED